MTDATPAVRILSLTWAQDGYTNAQQVNAREIATRLDPRRFQMTLLSDGTQPCSAQGRGAVRLLPLPERGRARRLLGRLLRGGFDILFYPGPGLPEAVFMRLPRSWPSRGRCRVVLPVEGDVSQLDEVAPWIRRRMGRLHRRADLLVPITDHVATTLRSRCGRSGPVVPVGVDLAQFRPRQGPRRGGPVRVLSVGTVKGWKRPELARAAATALPDVEFLWLGGGELLATEAAAAPPNLRFAGPCDRGALADRYGDADVFLHPSRMEGLPKVVLEAMASGLPVVVFDAWRPDFVASGGAGHVVHDDGEMIRALRRLADDVDLRARMGRAARETATGYSWDVVAGRWAALFEEEASRARGPG